MVMGTGTGTGMAAVMGVAALEAVVVETIRGAEQRKNGGKQKKDESQRSSAERKRNDDKQRKDESPKKDGKPKRHNGKPIYPEPFTWGRQFNRVVLATGRVFSFILEVPDYKVT